MQLFSLKVMVYLLFVFVSPFANAKLAASLHRCVASVFEFSKIKQRCKLARFVS